MKVLIFNLHFNLAPFTYNEIIYLSKRHNVKVLCESYKIDERFNRENIFCFSRERNSTSAKINDFLIVHDLKLSYKSNNLKSQFKNILDEFNPDIIQCHFGDEALILLDNIEINKFPIVIMFHGYDASAWLKNRTYINKYKQIFKNNVYAICCSENMKKRLCSKGFPSEKLSVIYYGVDLNYFSKQTYKTTRTKLFSQIAVFRTKKGIEFTIKAFKLFLDKYKYVDFKLILAGDGPLKNPLQKLTTELGLEKYIEFTGWLNQNQVRDLLDKTDVFVYHSITNKDGDMEGIPNSIIEAMAMELPVISTCHSGIPELVENNVNGFLVEEMDIENYTKAIKNILDFGYLQTNRKKIDEKFNLMKRNINIENFFIEKISESTN